MDGSEECFFTLIAEGDVCNVKQFLKKRKRADGGLDFNPNCINFENENAMSIAIEQGNVEMIKYLSCIMDISKNTMLLKAIYRGDVDLVKYLCEGMDADSEVLEGNCDPKQDSTLGEPEFSCDITPLILAAMEGHFEIIGYLIERGHTICQPHRPECLCDPVCLPLFRCSDALELAAGTLHLYSAISNPIYFVYVTGDPIHYAFKIHRRLIALSKFEKPYRREYQKLALRVRRFAACLVSECISSNEVELVLKQASTPKNLLQKIGQGDFPRLAMAIDNDQEEFLSQPNVQLFIQEKFYGSFQDWKYYSWLTKCWYPILRLFTLPVAYINFVFHPSSKLSKFYAAPINRMLHFLASYLFFLFVLFLESIRHKPKTKDESMLSIWKIVIFVYFCGLAGALFHQFLRFGYKRFLRFKWNVYDLVMLSMYTLSSAFAVSSSAYAHMPAASLNERKYWISLDPQLLSEGFAVVANVMAYMKLLFFIQINRVIGPVQVGMYRTLKTFVWYSIFGVAVVLAYSTAFSHFYSYYSGMTSTDPASKDKSTQEESFIDWISTFKTFFWGSFGQSDVESGDVVIDNALEEGFNNQHQFTQFIGYVALGSFTLLMVMIVKSMLIATMVNVYENMMDGFHKFWLCQRMEILVYFLTFPVMPPPFNLLPQAYSGRSALEKMNLEAACKKKGFDLQNDYLQLARILVRRYFNKMNKEKSCEEETIVHNDCGIPVAPANLRCQSV